jgi:hypothetical protein
VSRRAKRRLRLFGPAPVLEENVRPADFEFPRTPGGHLDALFVHESNLDSGQRRADETWTTRPCHRIGERHSDLGHPVALEQRMPGDLAPALQHLHRQRGRSGHHEPQAPHAIRPSALHIRRGALPCRDQAVIDRRHGGKDRDLTRREPPPDALGVEWVEHLAGGPDGQRTAQAVDDSVNVMQGQDEQQAIRR